LYPVIDRVDRIQIIPNQDSTDRKTKEVNYTNKVVAVLSASFYWRDALQNVLPTKKMGLVAVFENPCSAAFTYQIE
jgi:hypothetical protein